MPRRVLFVLALVVAVLLGPGFTFAQDDPLQATTKTVNVELILDASGSMGEPLDGGETRMAAAKRILRGVIEDLPEREGVNVGLRVYGHLGDNTEAGKPISCRSSELLVPVSGLDKTALIAQVEAIQPTGWTPIAYSLQQAAADFQPGGESITNAVVLVTDGEETCDPPRQSCDAAAALHQSAVTVTTHVVGFALTPEQTELVRCVAEEGGGQLFGADNAEELSTALGSALAGVGVTLKETAPPPGECGWAGTWSTNYGMMRLIQSDGTVSGDYEHDQGQIQGTASGQVLRGTWDEAPSRQPPNDAGDIEFTLADDCQSFTGRWRYGFSGDWQPGWDGQAQADTVTPVPPTGPGTGNTCNCDELASAQATIAAQATLIAELQGPTPTPTPVTVTPAPPETEEPRLTLQAEPPRLAVGEIVRVRGQSSGVGIPIFSVWVRDVGTELDIEVVRIDYEGRVEPRAGGSRILEFVEAGGGASGFEGTVEVTFRAIAPGAAEVMVGASGEVKQSSGGFSWGGASTDPVLITVVDAGGGTPSPGEEDATQTPTPADFITPDPAECSVTPRTAEELVALSAMPDQAAVDALEAAWIDATLTVPDGAPADAATTAAVAETYRLMIACFNTGSQLAAYAFWTDDALRQVQAQPPAGVPTPVPAEGRSAFRVNEVRILPDGQVVAVWQQRDPLASGTWVQILVRQDDRYLVDETLDLLFE